MTLYDLHCNACNAIFEVWQDRSAKGPFRCQKCGKRRAYRTILRRRPTTTVTARSTRVQAVGRASGGRHEPGRR